MKYFFIFILLNFLLSCTNNNEVFWCGDHACINNKEKDEYFKKTMIIEVRNIEKNDKKTRSEFEKIKQQNTTKNKSITQIYDKKLVKKTLSDEKTLLKEQKELKKQLRLEQKKKLKIEKKLAKQKRLDKAKIAKAKKKIDNKEIKLKPNNPNKIISEDSNILNNESHEFNSFVEAITKRNKLRPYPNINDIPN